MNFAVCVTIRPTTVNAIHAVALTSVCVFKLWTLLYRSAKVLQDCLLFEDLPSSTYFPFSLIAVKMASG